MINYVDKRHPCLDYSLLNYISGIYRTFIRRIFYSKSYLIKQEKGCTNRGPKTRTGPLLYSGAGRLKRLGGGPVVIGGDNLPSPVDLVLTELPNIGGGPVAPLAPPVPASLGGIPKRSTYTNTLLKIS